MMGVTLAGGVIVPLDPAHPPGRHMEILRDGNPSIILCSPQYGRRFNGQGEVIVEVDESFFISGLEDIETKVMIDNEDIADGQIHIASGENAARG